MTTKEDESYYKKQLVVDNRMCFIEVIETAGQGSNKPFSTQAEPFILEEYATLRDLRYSLFNF